MPEKPAFFSRFAVKFAEILGAGIATAVGGYLVAHVGAYLSSPPPTSGPAAAIEAPANVSAKPTERPRNRATASVPADTDTHAIGRDDHKEAVRPVAKPVEVSAPATATAAPTDNDDKRSRGTVTSRKPVADTRAAKSAAKETIETKPAAKETAEAKPSAKETAEAKAHEEAAVEDQVRAALANVDAGRTPAPNTPPPPATAPAPQTAAIPQAPPMPSNPAAPATTATSTAPQAVPAAPPLDIEKAASNSPTAPSPSVAASASAPQTAAEAGPLTTVEIKSLPIAGVDETSRVPEGTAQADNEADGKAKTETDKGFFSTIAHLPDILRANAHPPAGEPPRPPMPVGE